MKTFLRFITITALGVLFHFLYDWSGENILVGFFTSINESTWEHLKLLFFPMLFVTIFEIVFLKKKIQVLLPLRTLGILSGMLFIVVTFYTFWGISGRLVDFINISIYIFAVYFALLIEKSYTHRKKLPDMSICITILTAFVILFIIFTLHSPGVGIFYDISLHPKS